MNPASELISLTPQKEFFIGIDSDGCVFDTMEIKQKECFCPNFIKHFHLQQASRYARETWEFVNLYSQTRGCNRFHAVIRAHELMAKRKEIQVRGILLTELSALKEWVSKETRLGNPALEKYALEVNDPVIRQVLEWSRAVNKSIAEMVFGIRPFPMVVEALRKMAGKADLMVVSQTPLEALSREWKENQIEGFLRLIAGQEYGTKTEHIRDAAVGKYPREKILMIGDAPGDLKAATSNGVLFYPVNPGHEEASWELFYREALERFFDGSYQGDYQDALIAKFKTYLPENPSWESIA